MEEIKMYVDTQEELIELLKEWQPRLGLSDWHIGIALCEPSEMDLSEVAGECDVQWLNKCGTISVLKKEYMPEDLIIKQPHEVTVIHELLHFKFFSLEERTREEHYYEMKQHQLLEEMAKALFMAKYNVGYNWWIV